MRINEKQKIQMRGAALEINHQCLCLSLSTHIRQCGNKLLPLVQTSKAEEKHTPPAPTPPPPPRGRAVSEGPDLAVHTEEVGPETEMETG